MSRRDGQLLLVACLLLVFVVNMNRTLFKQEESPVFLSENTKYFAVELGHGFQKPSIHQFIDGVTLFDVIKLTDAAVGDPGQPVNALELVLLSGQRVDVGIKNDRIEELTVSWMSAAKRMALGIPLHPDHMSKTDWQVLPGVGEKMAGRIEQNRQIYGDFGSFWNLERVSGLGKKRLTSWNQYFFKNKISP